jgi:hypothetical protein
MADVIRAERAPQDAAETIVNDVTFDAALYVGQVVGVSWADRSGAPSRRSKRSIARFWANAEILKLNRTTARVRLLEDTTGSSPNVYRAGTERTVPRWPWAQWPDGISPRSTHRLTIWRWTDAPDPKHAGAWVVDHRVRVASADLLDATIAGIEQRSGSGENVMWTVDPLP